MMEPLISPNQRGFLRGRQMVSNILDMDMHSILTSHNHDRGAVILFDFDAAFPSISHYYLMSMLEDLGLPKKLQVVQALYHN
ncbi:MAG: hypothetical protein ACKPKO_12930, partial [Candidatus Fonsibacter sp.]